MTIKIRPYRKSTTVLEVDICVRLPNGEMFRERKRSPVLSRSGTKRWAEAREAEVIRAGCTPQMPTKRKVETLAKFWPRFVTDHCKANKQKKSGIESKEYHFRQYLEPVLGAVALDKITNDRIAELKRYMTTQLGGDPNDKSKRTKSASTINNCLSTLSRCLKSAVEWAVIDAMPCRISRLKKQSDAPRFYDFDAYEAYVSAAAELDPRVHLLVLLAGDAGLRKGELLALEQVRCDTKAGRVLVERSVVKGEVAETKGMESRAVPMTDRLRAALRAHKHIRGQWLLCHDDGSPISERTMRTWLARAQVAAKLPRTSGEVHILRHSFCSHLAMRGAPVTTIQKLAGHKHLATTIRYMHLADGETDRAIKLLNRSAI